MEAEISGAAAIWNGILTIMVTVMGYFLKKRDEDVDANAKAIGALELKVAENYATKPTVMALFQEAARTTEAAVARVEKSIDATNLSVSKQGEKIDKVNETMGNFYGNIMSELSKKT